MHVLSNAKIRDVKIFETIALTLKTMQLPIIKT